MKASVKPQTIRVAMGERIRQARLRVGLTQEELAARLGRNQRSISQLETGERNLPATDLVYLARELDVPIQYFFEDVLDRAEVTDSENLLEILLQEFTRLPTMTSRKAALQILRALGDAILTSTKDEAL